MYTLKQKKKIMKLTYQQNSNYDYKKHRNNTRDWGEGHTVPSQAKTVKEILERVIQGRPVPDLQMEILKSDEEITFDDINPLDKSPDKLTTGDEIRKELSELGLKRSKTEEAKKLEASKKAKDESKAKVRAEIEAEIKKDSEEKGTT